MEDKKQNKLDIDGEEIQTLMQARQTLGTPIIKS